MNQGYSKFGSNFWLIILVLTFFKVVHHSDGLQCHNGIYMNLGLQTVIPVREASSENKNADHVTTLRSLVSVVREVAQFMENPITYNTSLPVVHPMATTGYCLTMTASASFPKSSIMLGVSLPKDDLAEKCDQDGRPSIIDLVESIPNIPTELVDGVKTVLDKLGPLKICYCNTNGCNSDGSPGEPTTEVTTGGTEGGTVGSNGLLLVSLIESFILMHQFM